MTDPDAHGTAASAAKIAYLEMIQSVVNRMARNSFLIKGWSVTLVAALFALAAGNANEFFAFLAYFPGFMFWALDSYFLRQERLFRQLFDTARHPARSADFSMDTEAFEGQVATTWTLARSRTLDSTCRYTF